MRTELTGSIRCLVAREYDVMDNKIVTYIVNNISLPYSASEQEAFSVARKKLSYFGMHPSMADMSVYRRSIDARRRGDIRFVYSISAKSDVLLEDVDKLRSHGIAIDSYQAPVPVLGERRVEKPIIVVGAGPAGMFAALMLSEAGFPVILMERGGSVSERKRAVQDFLKTRILDTSTNIQFGAGGAGTFSDGKLVTRVNDSMTTYILKKLVEFGAPEEIMYQAKPHVGTDVLSLVVENILARLSELGATVMYHTQAQDFRRNGSRIVAVQTNRGDFECSALFLAIGHSARDTYFKLIEKGIDIEPKDFSVGMRIEHLRETINKGLYGDLAADPRLPVGEYNLSFNTRERGVYTFCMCPGGEVVAAASEDGGVVVNGMSYHARAGKNSNSAICCSIFKSDYGATPEAAIEFQRKIERAAFVAGGSDYSAPIITVGDFIRGECKKIPSSVIPTYMSGDGVKVADPNSYLPGFVTSSIRNAILNFDKKIPGFASEEAILTGPETRTSAPVRILRGSASKVASGYENLYPCGEGAGYAGGITSAALDGIKCALAFMSEHRP